MADIWPAVDEHIERSGGSFIEVTGRTDAAVARSSRRWVSLYRRSLVSLDVAAVSVAVVVGYWLRFSTAAPSVAYFALSLLIATGWLLALAQGGGYDLRHLATGPAEAKAVLRAGAVTIGVIAVYGTATHIVFARGFVIGVLPLAIGLSFAARGMMRRVVARRRSAGEWSHRILAVGTSESVRHLLEVTERAPNAGLRIVAACVEDEELDTLLAPGVPVVGGVSQVSEAAERERIDVVAVTGAGLGPTRVRELGWSLEGTGRGLVLAPSLTEIAGPRVRVSPVEGLPLMWVDPPQLGRVPRAMKRAFDLLLGSVILLFALPVLAAAAIAIKLDSPGPVLFRQRRLGAGGAEFTILKLRTMDADAEGRRAELLDRNEQDGGNVLFKIRQDPRVTRVGRYLRQLSLDELPQLFHVVSGRMSLVGPRPLAAADSGYEGSARRRLLMPPGLTGLWQVSGRSDLSWDAAVRLDLYYVENWSLGLDLGILARTAVTVLRRDGAY